MHSRSAAAEPHCLADEEAVVEDVVVGQGGTLGKPGGAAGELDVDRIVELQSAGKRREPVMLGRAGEAVNRVEPQRARHILGTDRDHQAQFGQPRRLQPAGRRRRQFGRQFAEHRQIVAGLEPRRGDQCRATRLVQRVVELGHAVGRVDVDEDQPGLGGGELGHHPFGVVRRPDADPLAGFEPERQQSRRQTHRPAPSAPASSSGSADGGRSARRARRIVPPRGRNRRRWSRRSAAFRWRHGRSSVVAARSSPSAPGG